MEEYIAGKHSVTEALRSGRTIHKIWIADNAQKHLTQPIIAEAKKAGVIVQTADKRKLDQMAEGVQHQGVVAQVAAYGYAEVDDILARAEAKGETPFLLILDEIEDPHNLGSILRTADCTGAHGVIIPKRRSVGLTATVSKNIRRRRRICAGRAGNESGADDGAVEGAGHLARRNGCVRDPGPVRDGPVHDAARAGHRE